MTGTTDALTAEPITFAREAPGGIDSKEVLAKFMQSHAIERMLLQWETCR